MQNFIFGDKLLTPQGELVVFIEESDGLKKTIGKDGKVETFHNYKLRRETLAMMTNVSDDHRFLLPATGAIFKVLEENRSNSRYRFKVGLVENPNNAQHEFPNGLYQNGWIQLLDQNSLARKNPNYVTADRLYYLPPNKTGRIK